MRRNLLKTLHHMTLESPIFESAIRVEDEVNDKPRTVSDYQFCRSTPKRRENPHVAGLSKPALELLDLDSNGLLEDPLATAEYLSGSKLLPGSRVTFLNNLADLQQLLRLPVRQLGWAAGRRESPSHRLLSQSEQPTLRAPAQGKRGQPI